MGSFGIGAIICGTGILPNLRSRASAESLINCSIGLLAIVISTMGYVRDFGNVCLIMGIGGISYTAILSTLYTTGLKAVPKWIGARVLAVYLLIPNGGLAVGSVIWGTMSIIFGIPFALSLSSFALAATTIAGGKRYNPLL